MSVYEISMARLADPIRLNEQWFRRRFKIADADRALTIALYKKHGFRTIPTEQHPVYKRCNIVMEKVLQA